MIKEFAFGTSNRHHFQDANSIGNWQGIDNDTFCSLYDYDDYVKPKLSQEEGSSDFVSSVSTDTGTSESTSGTTDEEIPF